MKKNRIVSVLTLVLVIAFAFGCKKRKQTQESADIAQQNAIAESVSLDLQYMAEEANRGPAYFSNFKSDCATVTKDTTGQNTSITIDYGPTNCMCNDGKNRRGKVFVDYVGVQYYAVGTVVTTTTEGYFVNDNGISGQRITTKKSDVETTISADLSISLADNNGTITWKSNRKRVQTEGTQSPFNLADDEYDITGSAEGINAKGLDYKIDITTTLKVQLGCRWIKRGILTISSSALDDNALVDYGDGKCDNLATISYKGKTRDINL